MPRAILLHTILLSGLALMLGGCAANDAVVQKGLFQHRKYVKPGWFVELGHRERVARGPKTSTRTRTVYAPPQDSADGTSAATIDQQDTMSVPDTGAARTHTWSDAVGDEVEASAGTGYNLDEVDARTGMDLRPMDPVREPFAYALAPTDDVGGVDIFALLGFIFAFLFPVAGIVLSAIGLHRTRGGGNGHGLALAGLIIGIVFLIAFGAVLI